MIDFVSIQNLAAVIVGFDFLQSIGEESFEVHDLAGLSLLERRAILDTDDRGSKDTFSLGQIGKRLDLGTARHKSSRANFMSVDLTDESLNLNVAVFRRVELGEINIFLLPVITLDLVIGRKIFGVRINRKHFAGVFAAISHESIVIGLTSCARQKNLGQGSHVNNVSVD